MTTHAARLRRHVSVAAAVMLTATAGSALVAPAGAATPHTQALVKVVDDEVARAAPDAESRRIEKVAARRPLTGVRTVLPELSRKAGSDGREWVRVRLPGRPNGRSGWIRAAHTRQAATGWRLELRLKTRRLTVYHYGRAVRRLRVVVGAKATPTPRGQFFIEEGVALSSHEPGGPFALATSARSTVLEQFHGGPGQIALHGTRGLSGRLGSAASHGCIRLDTEAITWLAQRVGAGVPLAVDR